MLQIQRFLLTALIGFALCGCGAGAGHYGTGTPSAANTAAITKHVVTTNVATQAMGTAAALDPTGISAIAASRATKTINEKSHERMVDESLGSLPPEQRDLLKQRMRGQISDEEARKKLFEQYGLDENGNPKAGG